MSWEPMLAICSPRSAASFFAWGTAARSWSTPTWPDVYAGLHVARGGARDGAAGREHDDVRQLVRGERTGSASRDSEDGPDPGGFEWRVS